MVANIASLDVSNPKILETKAPLPMSHQREKRHLLDITLVDLRVQAPKTSRPFASRCVFRASSSSPATLTVLHMHDTALHALLRHGSAIKVGDAFFLSLDICVAVAESAQNWPAGLYSTTLGRPPFFAITPTFSSGEAFQTSKIEA